MILQSLLEYYEILADKGEVPRPGWSTVNASFALNLSEAGELLYVTPLLEEKEAGKKKRMAPKELVVPEQVKKAVNIAPNLLCDSCAYLLGIDNKGKKSVLWIALNRLPDTISKFWVNWITRLQKRSVSSFKNGMLSMRKNPKCWPISWMI